MESVDITSDELREKGYLLKKEGKTIVLYYNGSCIRSDFFRNEWNKTVDRLEDKLSKEKVPQLIISETQATMATNYERLTNGTALTKNGDSSITGMTEIETPLEKLYDISPEEWQDQLSAKYNVLQEMIQKHSVQPLPQLRLPLEFALSVKNILNLADNTLPFAGFLLGVPSSLKTVAVELFRPYWHAKYSDDFSPKAFVSHYGGVPEEELQKIDLLPKIRYKFFLTPELALLFTGNEDDIKKAFGILTRLLDGKGLESDSGTQGGRGYHGDYMFTWIGAVVDVSSRVHRIMGNLGPKMYFLRLPKAYQKEKDLTEQIRNPRFTEDLAKIQKALFDYLKWFEASPLMDVKKEGGGLLRIVWDSSKDDIKALRYIAKLAMLIGPLRGVVEVWDTEDTQGSEYGFSIPIVEEPNRANQQLYNLARGHALIEGRNYVTLADIPLLIKVVLSTAPIARVAVFEMLLASAGTLKTADIKAGLGISHHTVHKTMAELQLLGLVDVEKEGKSDNSQKIITLKKKFRWCLGSRFRQLREGFSLARKARNHASSGKRSSKQGDNMKKDSTELEEISESVTHTFWDSFSTVLENESQKQTEGEEKREKPNNTVSDSALKQELISSGKYTASEATQIIKDMVKCGYITRLDFDVLVKNSQPNILSFS